MADLSADLQALLDRVAEGAARACGADDALVFVVEDDLMRRVAHFGPIETRLVQSPLDSPYEVSRAVLELRTLQIPDVQAAGEMISPEILRAAQMFGIRTVVTTPLVAQDRLVGQITLRRREVRLFTEEEIAQLETYAALAGVAIDRARLAAELEEKTREQAETLEEQAATNHILEIISQSPTDVQPVLDAIAEKAAQVSDARDALIILLEGDTATLGANYGPIPAMDFPRPVADLPGPAHQVLATLTSFHVPDVLAAPVDDRVLSGVRRLGQQLGFRSVLITPLQREDRAIGAIVIRRVDPIPFSDKQIALLESFGRQAVIAIENVRLFHELEERNAALHEALEHQTATAEVLSIISRSPTDVQPVLNAICESAARTCAIDDVSLSLAEGDVSVGRAHFGPIKANQATVAINPGGAAYRTIRLGETVQYLDQQVEGTEQGRGLAKAMGIHSTLFVPLLSDSGGIGWLGSRRLEVRPFTDSQIKLLKTFADQAVIAIENVRLFDELQARNRDLTESLAQQTATAEVLQTMSAAPEQLQLVLNAVAERATRVCNATDATIYIERDGVLRYAARSGSGVLAAEEIPVNASRLSGQAFTEQRAVHVPDALAQTQYTAVREAAEQGGARGYLAVPLIHEGRPQGVILARRTEPEPFTERQIELLKTFADQGAIAITLSRLIEEIRDKNQQLEVASHHKSEFLANMSHELRTPLNAIIGFSEVLAEQIFGELNEKQADYINDIVSSGRHLLSLINDILDLSKIEAGQMELELGEFSLPEALNNGLTIVKERAARHGIALSLDLDPRLAEITADERKVKQVLFNLLSNAVKFTPDGGKVSVHAQIVDSPSPPVPTPLGTRGEGEGEGARFAEIGVTDTGIGIAPEDQERIFEEFQQARESATSAQTEGTGLGLTLARRFVELHGGRIWVESEVEVGSTFIFTVPLASSPSSQPSPTRREGVSAVEPDHTVSPLAGETGPRSAPREGASRTILLIEDDPGAVDLFELYLGDTGFEVAVARDGAQGLDLARQVQPACIVLDVLLPTVDGWEVIAQAGLDPRLAGIPIIVASVVDERSRGLALGASDYLVKPVSRDALVTAVQRVVGSLTPPN